MQRGKPNLTAHARSSGDFANLIKLKIKGTTITKLNVGVTS